MKKTRKFILKNEKKMILQPNNKIFIDELVDAVNMNDKKYGLIMVFVWLFNPFQIVWCFKALSISIVNTMFMICLYLFVKLIKKDKLKNIIYFTVDMI